MGRLLLALAFICLGSGASAWAQSAREAYVDGAFLEAASLGEAQGQADDLALAARALLAEVVTGDPADIDVLLARAEANARRALAADRSNTEARLQLAAAIGMRGRRATIAEAMRKGYAGEGRALVRAAIVEAPREAWAHALEGGWNLEVVRRGGGVGAAYYGASVRAGHAAFERARALAPDDAIIAYQYAVALLELDPERYGAEAARLLAAASACRPADAFETRVKAKAASVATVLSARGPDAAVRLATARFR
ncbi:MAG: hypothetical protein IV086_16875 [Hyphomonadaceae bacterium]|nr:MAG: hypothetical protein FD160_2033 [Caulobacteraceae bacterium]MBT9447376.1 hypothetical protein [Hyphomonadaceae bacterium]TPW07456.1 MAG: hypothetical protein FD124_1139 [Alphaproteobacteria bacterium]